ncbi:hypothetical protein LAZ67_12001143 [Cordylochernes scorpioides]|uniref:Uncharacterized protein n=1 Tax=Cordylochernes scorpioides TaxID=51811 RepID=A0ABY6L3R8_9ARAC|nr:hypothetical protein LAZ67_12001143 [Cordylochernes scorpioides]
MVELSELSYYRYCRITVCYLIGRRSGHRNMVELSPSVESGTSCHNPLPTMLSWPGTTCIYNVVYLQYKLSQPSTHHVIMAWYYITSCHNPLPTMLSWPGTTCIYNVVYLQYKLSQPSTHHVIMVWYYMYIQCGVLTVQAVTTLYPPCYHGLVLHYKLSQPSTHHVIMVWYYMCRHVVYLQYKLSQPSTHHVIMAWYYMYIQCGVLTVQAVITLHPPCYHGLVLHVYTMWCTYSTSCHNPLPTMLSWSGTTCIYNVVYLQYKLSQPSTHHVIMVWYYMCRHVVYLQYKLSQPSTHHVIMAWYYMYIQCGVLTVQAVITLHPPCYHGLVLHVYTMWCTYSTSCHNPLPTMLSWSGTTCIYNVVYLQYKLSQPSTHHVIMVWYYMCRHVVYLQYKLSQPSTHHVIMAWYYMYIQCGVLTVQAVITLHPPCYHGLVLHVYTMWCTYSTSCHNPLPTMLSWPGTTCVDMWCTYSTSCHNPLPTMIIMAWYYICRYAVYLQYKLSQPSIHHVIMTWYYMCRPVTCGVLTVQAVTTLYPPCYHSLVLHVYTMWCTYSTSCHNPLPTMLSWPGTTCIYNVVYLQYKLSQPSTHHVIIAWYYMCRHVVYLQYKLSQPSTHHVIIAWYYMCRHAVYLQYKLSQPSTHHVIMAWYYMCRHVVYLQYKLSQPSTHHVIIAWYYMYIQCGVLTVQAVTTLYPPCYHGLVLHYKLSQPSTHHVIIAWYYMCRHVVYLQYKLSQPSTHHVIMAWYYMCRHVVYLQYKLSQPSTHHVIMAWYYMYIQCGVLTVQAVTTLYPPCYHGLVLHVYTMWCTYSTSCHNPLPTMLSWPGTTCVDMLCTYSTSCHNPLPTMLSWPGTTCVDMWCTYSTSCHNPLPTMLSWPGTTCIYNVVYLQYKLSQPSTHHVIMAWYYMCRHVVYLQYKLSQPSTHHVIMAWYYMYIQCGVLTVQAVTTLYPPCYHGLVLHVYTMWCTYSTSCHNPLPTMLSWPGNRVPSALDELIQELGENPPSPRREFREHALPHLRVTGRIHEFARAERLENGLRAGTSHKFIY